jgi:NAD(P)-dependent dehydrogenase (short-subunit alcohol dehydrogenase family)
MSPHSHQRAKHDLEGQVAIVAGGSSGIGQAIVLGLAEAGANVRVDYVAHPEATEKLERQVARSATKRSASTLTLTLAEPATCSGWWSKP